MVIREVYLGYLKVFLAWQDQLLQAGSMFEEEEVGTSEGCESCGGVQDWLEVILRNWQEERQVEVCVVVVECREGRSERAAVASRGGGVQTGLRFLLQRVASPQGPSLGRSATKTRTPPLLRKPPAATRTDASRLARRELATVYFLLFSCRYAASEISYMI